MLENRTTNCTNKKVIPNCYNWEFKSDKIKENFKKGILKIKIPKDEKRQPKKINIDVH